MRYDENRHLCFRPKSVLTLGSILGINDGYIPDGHNGLNHLQIRLDLAYYPVSRLELLSYAAYNVAIDREPDRYEEDQALRSFFWVGVGLICHF